MSSTSDLHKRTEFITYKETALYGAISSFIGYSIGLIYFQTQFQMAVAGFVALSLSNHPLTLTNHLSSLLEENRRIIWELRHNAWSANMRLSAHLCILFACVFCCGLLFQSIAYGSFGAVSLPGSIGDDGAFTSVWWNNLAVLLNSFMLACLFRSGGIMLILGYTATHTAGQLFQTLATAPEGPFHQTVLLRIVATIPSLSLQVLAYVVAGLAGVFGSKAVLKYRFFSAPLRRVLVASAVLLGVGLVLATAAAAVQASLAQPLLAHGPGR